MRIEEILKILEKNIKQLDKDSYPDIEADIDGEVCDFTAELSLRELLMVVIENPEEPLAVGEADCDDIAIECPADEIEGRLRAILKQKMYSKFDI